MNAIRFFAGPFRRVPRVRDVNEVFEARLTFGDRLADRVAAIGGSWNFIIGFTLFMVVWAILNTVVLVRHAFDPFPFIFLNLMLSMLAALQAPIIMMSQNRQSAKDKALAVNDFQINLKNEVSIDKILRSQTEVLQRLTAIEQRFSVARGSVLEVAKS